MAENGEELLQKIITELFSPLYQLAAAAAFVYFLYGVVVFINNLNDPSKKNEGKGHLLWGTVGLFIILSVGAILEVFNNTLGGLFTF